MSDLRARLSAALRALRQPSPDYDDDLPEDVSRIVARVRPYTMTSRERISALVESVRYIIRAGVPGAFAECGVWRGGSALAAILVLQERGCTDRDLYLYDTFEGMTEPGAHDTTRYGEDAPVTWHKSRARGEQPWGEYFSQKLFSEHDVRELLVGTGYPAERIHVIRGAVEQTLPVQAPGQLALLRLDTDWYASTRHELEMLYPRLSSGGVLIVDDYGHWEGCRRAVDEYFGQPSVRPVLLQRIDYTGRLALKP